MQPETQRPIDPLFTMHRPGKETSLRLHFSVAGWNSGAHFAADNEESGAVSKQFTVAQEAFGSAREPR